MCVVFVCCGGYKPVKCIHQVTCMRHVTCSVHKAARVALLSEDTVLCELCSLRKKCFSDDNFTLLIGRSCYWRHCHVLSVITYLRQYHVVLLAIDQLHFQHDHSVVYTGAIAKGVFIL